MPKLTILHDYLTICKPRVVGLMLITAWVGMYLANPNQIQWLTILYATIGIAMSAGSAATINHLIDRHIDAKMLRTAHRPIPRNRISPKRALIFAIILAISSCLVLSTMVNTLTMLLCFASLFSYAIIYTLYLKHATPQNIVIGGLAGAMPPLLGWTAISNNIDPSALILVAIIFIWTPPHFWALAIYRVRDYAAADVPMLPVTHGVKFTKTALLLYTILLAAISFLPFAIRVVGIGYLISATLLNAIFLYLAIKLYRAAEAQEHKLAIRTFNFSITYLFLLFSALVISRGLGD